MENRLINTRTNFSCLIIDALDKEHFDSRQSYVVYRLADAQLTVYTPGSIVLTTSKVLPLIEDNLEWKDYFISTNGQDSGKLLLFVFRIVIQSTLIKLLFNVNSQN